MVVVGLLCSSAAALALTAPGLVPGLGTPRPPAVPALPVPTPVLGPLAADAPTPSGSGLAARLDGPADAVPGRFGGVVVDPATGQTLWERDPESQLVPGSTGKLLTAAAALLTLNPTDTLATRVVLGPDPGTVVLIGGGDPTLTALPPGEATVYPDPSRLTELADQVEKAMTAPVRRVLVDTSLYSGPTLAEGWLPADIPAGYVAPIEPLMLDGGRIDPALQDGPRITDPALAAGRALAGLLGADPDDVDTTTAAPGAQRLGSVTSASMSELVEHTLRTSDNVLAEVLARQVALSRKSGSTFTDGGAAVLAALGQAGFDPAGTVLVDGSGLSTANRVTPRLLGSVLAAAAAPATGNGDVEFLRPVLTGLPVAGGFGTLDDRFTPGGPAAAGRGVVRAKTGTLTGVSSLAGVVTDSDGRLLVFALMSNGDSASVVRPKLDAIAAALSACGCR
ncbi:D-alanyl-D-alanine carboxypeptidase/D-alanyl-D-alanine endopeptidase [Pseudonocardia humida]|uniref:D-alanyl-D-alanine carboxypeptidase/D-alanyl-D-alanine-endopeptidase n=1 Tax=Pseudonocardia humida TaxID=2800819 RepID=A0ABT0ZWV3_9PSEU|nr:D-alanyl-D-alanine carboxypeptidase/D-alanyl-D-alanine-endopeptidase [Pseudonocardia humida]MCO1655224.1 D-alanyl-D-alanine carboxypeptidase/D-alanyl-D-alanine-endopeptidase [Pseudonocardia humida]